MPVTTRPGWRYPANAGRMSAEVVAESDQVVAQSDSDGREWITLLLGSPPLPQIVNYNAGTVQIRRVVST